MRSAEGIGEYKNRAEHTPGPGDQSLVGRENTHQIPIPSVYPSLVYRHLNRLFPGRFLETTEAIAKSFIDPLRDKTAKEVLKPILLDSEAHPEVLRVIGETVVRRDLVRAANAVSAELEQQKIEGGSFVWPREFIIPMFEKKISELQKDGVHEGLKPELREMANRLKADEKIQAEGPFSAATSFSGEEGRLSVHRGILHRGLDYFPGMPQITWETKGLIRDVKGFGELSLMRIENEFSTANFYEEKYAVYFGDREVGKFTVRRYGRRVERKLLITSSSGRLISKDARGTVWEDWWRQTKERIGVLFQSVVGR